MRGAGVTSPFFHVVCLGDKAISCLSFLPSPFDLFVAVVVGFLHDGAQSHFEGHDEFLRLRLRSLYSEPHPFCSRGLRVVL